MTPSWIPSTVVVTWVSFPVPGDPVFGEGPVSRSQSDLWSRKALFSGVHRIGNDSRDTKELFGCKRGESDWTEVRETWKKNQLSVNRCRSCRSWENVLSGR